MVQVLPSPPDWGTQWANILGTSGVKLGEGLAQHYQTKAEDERIKAATGVIADPNKSASEKYEAFASLPKAHQHASGPAFAAFIGPSAQAEEYRRQYQQQTGQPAPSQPQVQAAQPQQAVAQPGIVPQTQGEARADQNQDLAIRALAASGNPYAQADLAQRELAAEPGREFAKKEVAAASKGLEDLRAGASTWSQRENSVLTGMQAARSTPGLGRDYFADLFDAPFLKTTSGAALRASAKNLVGEKLAVTGSKGLNQWYEEITYEAGLHIGANPGANLTYGRIQLNELQAEQAIRSAAEQIAGEAVAAGKAPPGNIVDEARKRAEPEIRHARLQTAYDLQRYREIYEWGENGMELAAKGDYKVPPNTPLTQEMMNVILKRQKGDQKKAIAQAEKLGFDLENFNDPSILRSPLP